jgi:hypothetical protein
MKNKHKRLDRKLERLRLLLVVMEKNQAQRQVTKANLDRNTDALGVMIGKLSMEAQLLKKLVLLRFEPSPWI